MTNTLEQEERLHRILDEHWFEITTSMDEGRVSQDYGFTRELLEQIGKNPGLVSILLAEGKRKIAEYEERNRNTETNSVSTHYPKKMGSLYKLPEVEKLKCQTH